LGDGGGGRHASHLKQGPLAFGGTHGDPHADSKSDAVAEATDDPVFEVLRAWRMKVSKEAGVPAYVVFDNKTLAMIALAKPGSRAALLAVPGVGPTKLDRYAEDVLQIVRAG
jgi:ATP-dependent DNA helicase RecQ